MATYNFRDPTGAAQKKPLTPQVEPDPVPYEPVTPAAPFVPPQTAPTAPAEFAPDPSGGIASAYQTYLGRAASPDEIAFHARTSPTNYDAVIKNSTEAQQYASRSTGVPAAAPTVDQWGNQVGSQQANIDAFWNAATNQKRRTFTPAELQGWGVTQLSADKYQLPNGQVVDIIRDIGGANEALGQWSITGGRPGENGQGVDWGRDPSGGTLVGAGGGGGYGAGAMGAPGAAGLAGDGGAAAQQQAAAAWKAQIRAMLLAQMQGLQGGVDENDPAIKAQMDAARLEGDRSQQQIRKALAERLAATGGVSASGSNELSQGVQQSLERQGTGLATLKGDLMSRELQAKRGQYQNLLQLALQSGDTESAQDLQLRLANMDNEIKRWSLQQNQSQFDDQYGLDVANAAWERDKTAQRQKAGLDF